MQESNEIWSVDRIEHENFLVFGDNSEKVAMTLVPDFF